MNPIKLSKNKNEKMLSSVPMQKMNKESKFNQLINQHNKILDFFKDLTINNGRKGDNIKLFIKDYVYTTVMIAFIGVLGLYYTHNLYLVLALSVVVLMIPILTRLMGKKEYAKSYLQSFYRVIDYLILYTSGGVNIYNAIVETEKLLSEDDAIKENMQRAISHRNVAGIGAESYIDSLRLLNFSVNIPEIADFIRIIELQVERGTPITNSLYSQLNYIRQKETMSMKEAIAKAENSTTLLKTGFCTMPILLLFLVPPMLEVFVFFA